MGEEERVKAPKKTLKLLKYNLFLRLGCLHAPFLVTKNIIFILRVGEGKETNEKIGHGAITRLITVKSSSGK